MCENLPSGNYSDVKKSKEILATSDSSQHDYFVVLDFEYPTELNYQQNGFSMASDHIEITKEMLSMWQTETFHGKHFYACHYRIMKFYVRHGLFISNVHRVTKFEQSP